MIVVLSNLEGPERLTLSLHGIVNLMRTSRRRTIISQNTCVSSSPIASCGGAYANRPKLRGRKIAGRTQGRPLIRVPNGNDARRGTYRSDTGRAGGVSEIQILMSATNSPCLSERQSRDVSGCEQIVRHDPSVRYESGWQSVSPRQQIMESGQVSREPILMRR